MKISASIYSAKDAEFSTLLRELDAYQSDFFHIDCNDDPSVFSDIQKIRELSNTPIDLHLITPNPENYFDLIRKSGIASVTFQFEMLKKPIEIPSDLNCECGIAIVTETDISVFDFYAEKVNHILFMATTPGVSGQPFQKQNFRKIRAFRSKYPKKHIHVDGGINADLSFILRNMGVYLSVVGSYLLRQEFIGSAMMKLRSDAEGSSFKIEDFMLDNDEIPVLKASEFEMMSMLKTVEKYGMGFVNIVDEEGFLLGIISNADIRRALIRKLDTPQNIALDEIMNPKPAIVKRSDSVSDMMSYIKSLSFPILFLPVIDENGLLCGTLKFNNLIRGEL
ncbi:MAG: CBS domain-containing protein [Bacteroidales bacterium]|nr:CBS domain-containing protein [Bacteroidales bacterium]